MTCFDNHFGVILQLLLHWSVMNAEVLHHGSCDSNLDGSCDTSTSPVSVGEVTSAAKGAVTKSESSLNPHFPSRALIVERRSNLSLCEYLEVYDAKWPVIVTDIVPMWPAFDTWSRQYLCDNYGSSEVVMRTHGYPSVSEGSRVPLSTFCHLLSSGQQSVGEESDATGVTWSYIEDETFIEKHAKLKQHILTSPYTADDYFSLLPGPLQPWSHMFLWGSPHSRSPLHVDPYNWTATSALIMGRKEWKLFPPGQDNKLYVTKGARCGFPLDCIKYNSAVDTFSERSMSDHPHSINTQYIHVTQHPGDLLIIPTGWFHQAYNPVTTLSVSSEVMNAGNAVQVVTEMVKAGNIPEHHLPHLHANTDDLAAVRHWVQRVFSLIPDEVIRGGAEVRRAMMGEQ